MEANHQQGCKEEALKKFVCPNCVEDKFLKDCIEQKAQNKECDYCNREENRNIAAPLKILTDLISCTMEKYLVPHDKWCDDMIKSGLPEEHLVGARPIEFPLYSFIPYEGWSSPSLREDIEETLCGAWQGKESQAQRLKNDWDDFERTVKTRTRYFFANKLLQNGGAENQKVQPIDLLKKIGQMAEEHKLYQRLCAGMSLHRVRELRAGEDLNTFDSLGPPPEGSASAGRMNPAGISYFYLAKERKTAIGEVLNRPPCKAITAEFTTKRMLLVLDLTELPPEPSIFDLEKYDILQSILFLKEFVRAITQPVSRDGREHIDYAPSQVVSEFFAQVFSTKEGHKIDGMIYPSAVVRGGKNVVLFPPRESTNKWHDLMRLPDDKVLQIEVDDWCELTSLIS
jgi:RES domain-containing protein